MLESLIDDFGLDLKATPDFVIADLFCCAGGCGMGYYQAFIERYPNLLIVGVDIDHQRRYPAFHDAEYSKHFIFIQADALDFIAEYGDLFDFVHASPPCQVYSVTASLSNGNHPDLVEPTRKALVATGKPYVIENVPGAPLDNPLMLCGTMFGLRVIRHRLFETNPAIWFPPYSCNHWGRSTSSMSYSATGITRTISVNDGCAFVTVAGNNYLVNEGRMAMGIDWMSRKELSQAIPPAYTKWIGEQMLAIEWVR